MEILYGKYPYKFEFNPPPKTKVQSEKPKKRLLSQDSQEDVESQSSKKSKVTSSINERLMGESSNKKSIDESIEADSDLAGPSTSGTNAFDATSNGKWADFDKKTLYVYTSNGCKGRSKVRKSSMIFYLLS